MLIIISITILILSVVIHELSHGFMADYLGDPTARLAGRLTLNPIKHLDPVGSVIVPILTSMAGFTFGWAKPVPYNPYNLKDKRRGEFLIAAAGPVSNLILAFVFGTIIRLTAGLESMSSLIEISTFIVIINIILAVFNLIPLPPLDGSKLLFAILPNQYGRTRQLLETYSPIFVLIAVFFLWQIISPIIPVIFRIFTGVGL
ncbi:MAG: hypothetical protein A3B11_00265 [Candidatus Taylorbacteria bacterium RIFCSPLOWO2_01_FULL_44_26]|uniref:Peptidase M50 domain-containing protein n=2 Tax=Candidatus Tayloriibacteriota TaxID=1817919 RepID=A0A1G2ML28_9BACT|nr:MAG: hypothetical protein A3D50_01905 [Candidatus Taylorbacteria bacterium RIFCSPHIGHO2_02_FULL_44_12]OHA31122.1 MAG: hypothetical protein A3B11_00265 [Candidatus Taylorbacteria bacterium RIFCSPLOWO2_01_FULL_44_26]